MSFGLVVIGDEILSGKREDKHFAKAIELLAARGLALAWAHYLPDDRDAIAAFMETSMNGNDIVFCTGGIGGTPDDHTRQAVAIAAEVPLTRHRDAARLIEERINDIARQQGLPTPVDMSAPENQLRLSMAELPRGADLIPNPYNKVPGFSVGQHYFFPGFPVMAWPMMEWVLDTRYRNLFHRDIRHERSVIVYDVFEAQLTPLLEAVERRFRAIKVFSLPSVGDEMLPRHIEVGVKGDPVEIDPAFDVLLDGMRRIDARLGEQMRR